MNAPVQVQRQAEAAAQRLQQIQTPPGSPEETPPAAPAAEPAPPVSPAAPDPLIALQGEMAKMEQRYRSLQGMFDQERLARMRLQDELEASRRAPEPAAPPQPQQAATSKDIEEFGQETVEFVTRIAASIVEQSVPRMVQAILQQQIAPVQQQVQVVQQRVQKSAEQAFYDDLAEKVPDWEKINVDPRFIQWLGSLEPLTQQPYQVLLNDAHAQLDLNRTAAVFTRFKEIANLGAPRGRAQAPVDERATMVEPGRTAVTPAGNQQQKRVYTRAEVSQFYRDVTAGRLDRAAAAATERDIMQAQSEGRIV